MRTHAHSHAHARSTPKVPGIPGTPGNLNEINDLLNSVWKGPGSMSKLIEMMYDMRISRLFADSDDTKDPLKGYETPTIESNLGENVVDRLEK